jgi:hypothetical protein
MTWHTSLPRKWFDECGFRQQPTDNNNRICNGSGWPRSKKSVRTLEFIMPEVDEASFLALLGMVHCEFLTASITA